MVYVIRIVHEAHVKGIHQFVIQTIQLDTVVQTVFAKEFFLLSNVQKVQDVKPFIQNLLASKLKMNLFLNMNRVTRFNL